MTKQIEGYPKLDRWLDNNALSGIECSKSEYYAPFDAVSAKMLEMQQQINSLTEQNKELQELQEQVKKAYVVTYMDNCMGVFFTEKDAIEFSGKFGGVYHIESYEIKSAIGQFHNSFN